MRASIGGPCNGLRTRSQRAAACSGQAAALAGGTTMHIDFVLPVNGSISAGMRVYKGLAERACMDYGFHVAMTAWNDDVKHDMAAAVAEGVNSFKFFMAYKVRRCYACARIAAAAHAWAGVVSAVQLPR